MGFLRYTIKSGIVGRGRNAFIQGITYSASTGWNINFTFPVAFPNKCLMVMHKPNLNYDANDWHSSLLTANNVSKTGYTAWFVDGGGFVSLAFGY